MDEIINIGIGIVVSVILFIGSYHKTVGAKKERINSTYYELVKIIIRNLVNNDHLPSIPEINRLLQTKCIENRVNITDLPDEVTFIYAVYTRIAEDEILSSERKNELIHQINNHIKRIEKKAPSITIEEEKEPGDTEEKYRMLLALSSILIATSAVFLMGFISNQVITVSSLIPILVAVVAMTIVLALITTLIKLKEEQEEPIASRKSIIKEYKGFEGRIFKIIKGLGEAKRKFVLEKDAKVIRFDISFKRGNKTFLIEVKMIRDHVPKFVIETLKTQAKFAKKIDKHYILILVVNNKKYLASYLDDLNKTWDYIFDENELREFRNKLVHNVK